MMMGNLVLREGKSSGGRGGEIRRKGRGNSEAGGLGREGEGTWGKNKDKSLW